MLIRLARALAFPALLLALNFYFSSDLFRLEYSGWMGSIEAAYVSISRYILENWHDLTWFPLWYGGIPFQNTYPPLLHVSVAVFSATTGFSAARAHHIVTAVFYCLGPLTLYSLAVRLTASRWYSFWAAFVYSIVSPSVFLIPAVRHDLGSVWSPRRFQALAFYGEGPHIAAMAFLPLALLCLDVALSKRKPYYYVLAALSMDAVVLSNWIGAFALALAVLAYLVVKPGRSRWLTSLGIGALAYAFACSWIPPSTIRDIRYNAQFVGDFQHVYERFPLYAVLGIAAVFTAKSLLRFWGSPAYLQFFLLLALMTTGITLGYEWFGIAVVPQAARYHLEMDMALCLAATFAGKLLLDRLAHPSRVAIACVLVLASVIPLRLDRRYARRLVHPANIAETIEYKSAKWFDSRWPKDRVLVPDSISFWLNAFTDTPQQGGGFDQGMVNRTWPHADYQIFHATGPHETAGEISLLWLKAFGVHAVEILGPSNIPLLKEAMRHGDDAVYVVPGAPSLAHVIPASTVVQTPPINGLDVDQTRRYVAALDATGVPASRFRWITRHSAEIQAELQPGAVVSVQQTYHPGWRASVNGAPRSIQQDGLGQMIIDPECLGHCVIELIYDGGTEMAIARVVSWSSFTGCLVWILFRRSLVPLS